MKIKRLWLLYIPDGEAIQFEFASREKAVEAAQVQVERQRTRVYVVETVAVCEPTLSQWLTIDDEVPA